MEPAPLSFDALIAPLGRERFLADTWTKSFLHQKGSKGRFAHLLTWEKLNEVLEWQSPPPFLKLFREGNRIDPGSYIDHRDDKPPEGWELNAGRVIASLAGGSALVIDAIQKNVPRIKQVSEAFEDVFHASNQVNLYAGWGSQNTFHLHWDPQEVFILQLSGRKHWKIYPPTRPYPLKDDAEKNLPPSGPPVFDGVIEDGDFLYVPRGWWHDVRPLGEPSLHLNVGIETATGMDFLRWWLPRLLRHAELRQDMPLNLSPAEGEAYFARLLDLIAKDGKGQNLPGEFLREWDAFRPVRPRLRLPHAVAEQKTPLDMATRVRLAQRDALFIEYKPGDRMAKFQAIGGQYDASPGVVPALQRLSGHRSLTVQELCQGISDPQVLKDVIAALEVLASVGVIFKEAGA